jgi:CubicO group peptidase (beta-lactamase class C family)
VERVWEAVEALYRTGLHQGIQLCVRREGQIAVHRAIGYAAGNGPHDEPDEPRVPLTLDTPFAIYSASKAVTAMVIHKLDEQRVLHLDDRVCDYIPEFAAHGKDRITIRHVLGHRAGIPNLPKGSLDLDMLGEPEHIVELISAAKPSLRPGWRLAYHALTGGFVLGEVVRRATGRDIRNVLQKEIKEPLGFHWFDYGVQPEEVDAVAQDAVTGLPVLPPFSWLFERALGMSLDDSIQLAGDPRFLTSIVPAANVVCNGEELSAFYQCLVNEGELDGVRVFDPRTVHHATGEQAYMEVDFTLIAPVRHGLGFMLGNETVGLFGLKNPHAFGHVGLSNIFSWGDPDRRLAVALMTSGKPFISLDAVRLLNVIFEIGRAFPPCEGAP